MTRASAGDPYPFRHAAAIYDSDEGFLSAVVPFVLDGVAAGEPTIVALNSGQQALLGSEIGQPTGVSVFVPDEHYNHPLKALGANQALFERHLSGGADRVRLVGDLPQDDPASWRAWARYEALCNHHFVDLPVSALCTYDTRITHEDVLSDVRRLHALLVDDGGRHAPNHAYMEPQAFLAAWTQTTADPLEAREPEVAMLDPMPSEARHVVTGVAARAGVESEGIVTAVNEALANAYLHGLAPVTLRVWSETGRVLVSVADTGPGPEDPFVGLLPPGTEADSGRGLWISNQVCHSLTISAEDDGCVVRIMALAAP